MFLFLVHELVSLFFWEEDSFIHEQNVSYLFWISVSKSVYLERKLIILNEKNKSALDG